MFASIFFVLALSNSLIFFNVQAYPRQYDYSEIIEYQPSNGLHQANRHQKRDHSSSILSSSVHSNQPQKFNVSGFLTLVPIRDASTCNETLTTYANRVCNFPTIANRVKRNIQAAEQAQVSDGKILKII